MKYAALFEPLKVGPLSLRNRLVMAPMTTISGEPDGSFSDDEIAYLGQRSTGGLGMVLTPACYCHKSGHAFERQVGCHSDDMHDSLSRCAETIKKGGAAAVLQIHHGGNAAKEIYSRRPPMAPSAVHNRRETSELPQAMTVDEIRMISDSFASAALRAKRAGFDSIELHGANTYLFQQFFSPFTNKREDDYGCQSIENRSRFAREVIVAVRQAVGRDYPLFYRISPEEPEPDGYSTSDTIELLKLLVPLGLDLIDVSSWEYGKSLRNDLPEGSHPTLEIKKAFPEIPVIGVGNIFYPEQAIEVLNEGVDLVALGRALLLNHDWVSHVKNDTPEKIKIMLGSEQEREQLQIPTRMKEYTKRFFTVI